MVGVRDRIPIVSTRHLAAIVAAAVRNVITDRFSRQLHPAARTFQTLRNTRKQRVKRTLEQYINFFAVEGALL